MANLYINWTYHFFFYLFCCVFFINVKRNYLQHLSCSEYRVLTMKKSLKMLKCTENVNLKVSVWLTQWILFFLGIHSRHIWDKFVKSSEAELLLEIFKANLFQLLSAIVKFWFLDTKLHNKARFALNFEIFQIKFHSWDLKLFGNR